jgi:Outer membrane protein beta-barrel domain
MIQICSKITVKNCLTICFIWGIAFPAVCQTEKFSSRIFFPGLIGLNIPSGDEQTSIKSGFSLVTAIEYRPKYTNNIFFRFNYDALSNKYKSFANQVPTNVTQGKLNADFFLLGVGYRRQVNGIGIYALFQPGLNTSNYNTVSNSTTGVSVGSISNNHLSFKFSTGIEYYIVPHFALVAEPSFYHLLQNRNSVTLNPNYLSYNIGFTTTLF